MSWNLSKKTQASGILINTEGLEAIKKLEQKLGIQVKFIHAIRNPFDNIATMALRRANEGTKGREILKVTTMCPVPDTPINRSKHFPIGDLQISSNLAQFTSNFI